MGFSQTTWTTPDKHECGGVRLPSWYKWADPPEVAQAGLEHRITFAGNG